MGKSLDHSLPLGKYLVGMNDSLVAQLAQHFPAARLKTRLIDRHAYSSDASFYTLVPRAVVFPDTADNAISQVLPVE